ncbi:MAG: 2-hydroxymuconate tautomerase [Bacilli bacterium]
MPFVTIKLLEGRTYEQKKAMVERVAAAVSETTNAPLDKVVVFIEEMKPDEYAPGGKLHSEK